MTYGYNVKNDMIGKKNQNGKNMAFAHSTGRGSTQNCIIFFYWKYLKEYIKQKSM